MGNKTSGGLDGKQAVCALILAFVPGVQLDTIARNSTRHAREDEERLLAISRRSGSLVQETGLSTAASYRLSQCDALVLSRPSNEVELATGRPRLSVTVGVTIGGHGAASPEIFVQLIAALDLAIADICGSPDGGSAVMASILSSRLQRDDDDAFRSSLRAATESICNLFTQIINQSSARSNIAGRGRQIVINGRTDNNHAMDSNFALCRLVMERLHATGQSQIGHFYALRTLDASIGNPISAHQFVGDGVAVCWGIGS
jgi:hypothetical protein